MTLTPDRALTLIALTGAALGGLVAAHLTRRTPDA